LKVRPPLKVKANNMLCFFLGSIFVLAAVNSVHSQDVTKLKYSNWFPPTHKMSVMAEE
jgi:hypothetical protein